MITKKQDTILKSSEIETPLGRMLALSDEKALYLLDFVDRRGLQNKIEKLCAKMNAIIIPETSNPIESIKTELASYFNSALKEFKTPLHLFGSPFQKSAWNALQSIPYGKTRSYKDQAHFVGNKSAHRAVANANGANNIAIVIPCHRIINSNGNLGGYGGGIDRKKWLLDFESHTP